MFLRYLNKLRKGSCFSYCNKLEKQQGKRQSDNKKEGRIVKEAKTETEVMRLGRETEVSSDKEMQSAHPVSLYLLMMWELFFFWYNIQILSELETIVQSCKCPNMM